MGWLGDFVTLFPRADQKILASVGLPFYGKRLEENRDHIYIEGGYRYYPVGTVEKHHPVITDENGRKIPFREFVRLSGLPWPYDEVVRREKVHRVRYVRATGSMVVLRASGKVITMYENFSEVPRLDNCPGWASSVTFGGEYVEFTRRLGNVEYGVRYTGEDEFAMGILRPPGLASIVLFDRVGPEKEVLMKVKSVIGRSWGEFKRKRALMTVCGVDVLGVNGFPRVIFDGPRFRGLFWDMPDEDELRELVDWTEEYRENGWTAKILLPVKLRNNFMVMFERRLFGFQVRSNGRLAIVYSSNGKPVMKTAHEKIDIVNERDFEKFLLLLSVF